ASRLRTHDRDSGWAVETVLRSQAFFAEANLGNRILGPVEYVIGSVRALDPLIPFGMGTTPQTEDYHAHLTRGCPSEYAGAGATRQTGHEISASTIGCRDPKRGLQEADGYALDRGASRLSRSQTVR